MAHSVAIHATVRRHKFPKAKYRVTNWHKYDTALVRRGSLTLWSTEEGVAARRTPATGERGGQPIENRSRASPGFHHPPRQNEGLLRSIAQVLELYPRSHDIESPEWRFDGECLDQERVS